MKETFPLAVCLLQVKLAQGTVSLQVKEKVQETSCLEMKECEGWLDRHQDTSLTLKLVCEESEDLLGTWVEPLLRVVS